MFSRNAKRGFVCQNSPRERKVWPQAKRQRNTAFTVYDYMNLLDVVQMNDYQKATNYFGRKQNQPLLEGLLRNYVTFKPFSVNCYY